MNVYDVAMDFMLMDAFCDMENPPSALLSVINNGWISDGIRRSVRYHNHTYKVLYRFLFKQLLNTAVWSILKAKMSLLKASVHWLMYSCRCMSVPHYRTKKVLWLDSTSLVKPFLRLLHGDF